MKKLCRSLLAAAVMAGGLLGAPGAADAAVDPGTWSVGPTLLGERSHHTATTLRDGRVLVVGGSNHMTGYETAMAEVFDPATGGFRAAGVLPDRYDRVGHTATLLADGRVLVLGGALLFGSLDGGIWDPATEQWTVFPVPFNIHGHTATLLADGRVLVAGGYEQTSEFGVERTSGRLAVFDPATNDWAIDLLAPQLLTPRADHITIALPDGRALIAGGVTQVEDNPFYRDPVTSSTEIWSPDPIVGWRVAPGPSMRRPRGFAATASLPGDRTLLVGGDDNRCDYGSAEVFDATTMTWQLLPTNVGPSLDAGAAVLSDGRVLVTGGICGTGQRTDVFDPVTGRFDRVADARRARDDAPVAALLDGRALVTGGIDPYSQYGNMPMRSTEIWDPRPNTAPIAVPDDATVAEDGTIEVIPVANDVDPDGDTLTIGWPWSTPTHGTLTQLGGGRIRYTPNRDFSGTDSFTYRVVDEHGAWATGTVTVTVTPVNDAPVAADDTATAPKGRPVTVAPLANDTDVDGDTLAIADLGAAAHGTVVANPDGTVSYVPAAGYKGSDAFTYTVSDPAGARSTATVHVTVTKL